MGINTGYGDQLLTTKRLIYYQGRQVLPRSNPSTKLCEPFSLINLFTGLQRVLRVRPLHHQSMHVRYWTHYRESRRCLYGGGDANGSMGEGRQVREDGRREREKAKLVL